MRKVHCILHLLIIFIMKSTGFLPNDFFPCMYWNHHVFSFFSPYILFIECIMYIDFRMLIQPYIPVIYPTWPWYVILFMCWVCYAIIVLRVFMFRLISYIGLQYSCDVFGFIIFVILASQNELRNVVSSFIFGRVCK